MEWILHGRGAAAVPDARSMPPALRWRAPGGKRWFVDVGSCFCFQKNRVFVHNHASGFAPK
ncbi:hypothetical protein NH44784_024331 [Achromobacter xylosoxidans NH44784-1996]|nr:hypothetical protein NH44784_024331 [Achromobacter xylosoxidans NH44784-1996]